jgi:hypothetical protein
LGKYDVFTITGTPGSDTSKLIESSSLSMLVTVTAGSGFFSLNRASASPARAHSSGPPSASGRSSPEASSNQAAAGASQCLCDTPVSTTGSLRSGSTSSEPRTS